MYMPKPKHNIYKGTSDRRPKDEPMKEHKVATLNQQMFYDHLSLFTTSNLTSIIATLYNEFALEFIRSSHFKLILIAHIQGNMNLLWNRLCEDGAETQIIDKLLAMAKTINNSYEQFDIVELIARLSAQIMVNADFSSAIPIIKKPFSEIENALAAHFVDVSKQFTYIPALLNGCECEGSEGSKDSKHPNPKDSRNPFTLEITNVAMKSDGQMEIKDLWFDVPDE